MAPIQGVAWAHLAMEPWLLETGLGSPAGVEEEEEGSGTVAGLELPVGGDVAVA